MWSLDSKVALLQFRGEILPCCCFVSWYSGKEFIVPEKCHTVKLYPMKGTILTLLVFKVQEAKYSLDISPEKYCCVPDLITPGSNSIREQQLSSQFYKDAKTQANNGDRIETHICLAPNPVRFPSCKAALDSDSVCSLLV